MMKKVISLENVYSNKSIVVTKGKIYKVCYYDSDDWIIIINNNGIETSYLRKRFEELETHRNNIIVNILS